VKAYCQIRDVNEALAQHLGREPSLMDLAEEMGMPPGEVEECLNLAEDAVSLDTPVGEDGNITLAEYLAPSEATSTEERAIRESLFAELLRMLETLTPREQKVLRLRYGLDGEEPLTLGEVGLILHLTKERIRQIEKRAKEKLIELARERQLLEGVN